MPSFCFLALAALAAAAQPSVRVITRAGAAPGEAALVVVRGQMAGHPPAGSLAGQPLHFWRGKRGDYLALAGFDLDISTGAHRLKLELRGKGGRLHYWSSEILVKPKAFPVEDVRVDEKYVEPSRAEELRAEAEASGLRRLFARAGPRPLFESRSFRSFRSPIPGALSSRFGERRFFNGVPKAPHSGADLRAKMGVPVKAAARGRVALVADLFYSGWTIVLDHGLGLYTLYAHLSRVDVKQGQLVRQGRRLGLVGATGRVTGPHLHWGAKLDGARIDPFCLVALPLSRY